ncbi:MAG: hypothetical protein HRU34_08555 [Richelia sp.]|nr:hypothetical protein [Richelia sp.]CDN17302.1 Esterase/lipase [Richelia intracellularis]
MELLNREPNKKNILPMFAFATFGIHTITLLILMFHGSMLQQLSRQLTPRSLVQLLNGQAITVEPQKSASRSPQTIRRFVGETMTLMFTWSQQQTPQTVWQVSSELLSSGLRHKFQSEVIPDDGRIANFSSRESVLLIRKVSQPEMIGEGKWKVEILANRVIFTDFDRLGQTTPFNKHILVRARDTPEISLPQSPVSWNLAAYRLAEARLEIYNICEIDNQYCTDKL